MKKSLLLFLLILTTLLGKASDTLTFRQVFNFNVGDTFDYVLNYQTYAGGSSLNGNTQQRFVVSSWQLSPDLDTLDFYMTRVYPHYGLAHFRYTNLDSSVLFNIVWQSHPYTFDTASIWNARINNIRYQLNPLHSYTNSTTSYVAGMGKYSEEYQSTNQLPDGTWNSYKYRKTLIYYHGTGRPLGNPYYTSSYTYTPHYTPIPEECAIWNYNLTNFDVTPYVQTMAQMRTGSRISIGGHFYSELLYRYFDPASGFLSDDTLRGYFRNDTARKMVLFRQTISDTDVTIYDFNKGFIDTLLPYYVQDINSVNVSGRSLTRWSEENVNTSTPYVFSYHTFIEGIGSEDNFLHIPRPWFPHQAYWLGGSGPGYANRSTITLTSFCVCGQAKYPDTTNASGCRLLTGLESITSQQMATLYPNPLNDKFFLNLHDLAGPSTLTLTDLVGMEWYKASILKNETTHDISTLPVGIYFWALEDKNSQIIQTGKIVKQ